MTQMQYFKAALYLWFSNFFIFSLCHEEKQIKFDSFFDLSEIYRNRFEKSDLYWGSAVGTSIIGSFPFFYAAQMKGMPAF